MCSNTKRYVTVPMFDTETCTWRYLYMNHWWRVYLNIVTLLNMLM